MKVISILNLKGCLTEDYCTWEDLIEDMRKECGMDLKIRKNDKDVKI